MSGTLNKVMLIGHLGDEVKMHYFEGGGCIGRFPLATNETYVSKQTNERVTNTEWHNIVVRNKAAEICEKYLSKGDRIYVEGRLKTRKWQDDAGNERYSTEIQCTDFTFLTTKKESEGQASNKVSTSKPNDNQQTANEPIGEEDDDLPF
ncbi:MAG: single-stranded DNA-binding protein [Flavobacteriales bacterium]|nr:single-stranded DNA-binding protein [Flavobacteriia bacterium]NCP05995.1 single-stranded DNA-binding protein [Flavobacteriales bacterium]PIV92758.1 MAG: single-stranded DNA-binding protein [Flavobacteriaceae bacterium CG17_big_fil_post_rev_8_21_14_2_50_33_15]PIY10233.1 MAG: single-stranded DNA-binding protein [Flavobacteriaceae bacterium CG_4_10_14_3_um_filter_33_47]PJB18868.1 MAG: single-stranded DNA-binding protein [Flavobacteriaceae bacterium CG_4_9_14_3_um_filter_33_16]